MANQKWLSEQQTFVKGFLNDFKDTGCVVDLLTQDNCNAAIYELYAIRKDSDYGSIMFRLTEHGTSWYYSINFPSFWQR